LSVVASSSRETLFASLEKRSSAPLLECGNKLP
jgi:hypothetical protein